MAAMPESPAVVALLFKVGEEHGGHGDVVDVDTDLMAGGAQRRGAFGQCIHVRLGASEWRGRRVGRPMDLMAGQVPGGTESGIARMDPVPYLRRAVHGCAGSSVCEMTIMRGVLSEM